MSYDIELVSDQALIKIRYQGKIELGERMEAVKKISKLFCSNRELRKALVDLKDSELDFSLEDLYTLGEEIGKCRHPIAYILNRHDPENRFIKRIAEKHGASIAVFESSHEAGEWVVDGSG